MGKVHQAEANFKIKREDLGKLAGQKDEAEKEQEKQEEQNSESTTAAPGTEE